MNGTPKAAVQPNGPQKTPFGPHGPVDPASDEAAGGGGGGTSDGAGPVVGEGMTAGDWGGETEGTALAGLALAFDALGDGSTEEEQPATRTAIATAITEGRKAGRGR